MVSCQNKKKCSIFSESENHWLNSSFVTKVKTRFILDNWRNLGIYKIENSCENDSDTTLYLQCWQNSGT